MGLTAFGDFVTELGDIAEAVIGALKEWKVIDYEVTETKTLKPTKRLATRTTTTTRRHTVSAFDILFLGFMLGLIKIGLKGGDWVIQMNVAFAQTSFGISKSFLENLWDLMGSDQSLIEALGGEEESTE